ncbi:MAG: hypothetical protein OZ919_12385, partial [Xanthomonadaceae bacterium]|nr:hypothetical protein [Xanthomonadaceae bacterium]
MVEAFEARSILCEDGFLLPPSMAATLRAIAARCQKRAPGSFLTICRPVAALQVKKRRKNGPHRELR